MRHLLLVSVAAAACASAPHTPAQEPAPSAQLQPPVAQKIPRDVTVHGDRRIDDYFWLREKGTPPVEQYLRAEAAYADAFMAPTADLQKTLYAEMLSRIQETDTQVPFLRDGFYYATRTEKGKQYPILFRKPSPDAPEQVIVDVNALAQGRKFLSMGAWIPSDDGNLLAYSTDETGYRQYDLHVRDLRTGRDGAEKIPRVDSFAWARDGKTIFYVTEDATTKRANQLWRHTLGAAKDDLVYEEKDEMFYLQVERSRSREYFFATSSSHTTSEVRYWKASDAHAMPAVIQPREKDREYYVDHRGDLFYIRENSTGRNFRLVTAPVASPSRPNWKELIAHSDAVMIDDLDAFRDHLVLSERQGGLPRVAVLDYATGATRSVQFPEADYNVSPEHNAEFTQTKYRINYQSLVTPPSVFDVDMQSLELTRLKQQPVPNYDASKYEVARLEAPAADGVRVPVAVLRKKGQAKPSPLLLYGYGSYGISIPDNFSSDRFSLVDRGFTFAVAHIRGGGELGKKWHDAGRMMNKKNTFTDFIAAAEFLVKEGYTTPGRLAIMGGSAGGLLMGAVTNLRPDLFHVVMAYVPFVDVVNTELDESLPGTVTEWEEWGNPHKPDEYAYIRSYSPYDNVEAKPYPTLFVRSAYNDSQVMYWEPAKWVAKLRATKTDRNPLLFKINLDPAGHGGASGRYDRLRDTAYDYSFLLTADLPQGPPAR